MVQPFASVAKFYFLSEWEKDTLVRVDKRESVEKGEPVAEVGANEGEGKG